MRQTAESTSGLTHEADSIFRIPTHLPSNLRFQTRHSSNIGNWLLIASPHFLGSLSLQWNTARPARGITCCLSSLRVHVTSTGKQRGSHLSLSSLCSHALHLGHEWLWSYLTDCCEDRGVGHHLERKKKDKVQITIVTGERIKH